MSSTERFPIEEPDRSLGDLVGDLAAQVSGLVGNHIDLAKAELRDEARGAARAGGLAAAAGVSGLVALIMLSEAAGWGLSEVMDPGWAFLIVGAAWTAAGAVLGASARRKMREIDPAPKQTMHEIQEDKQWLKTQAPTN